VFLHWREKTKAPVEGERNCEGEDGRDRKEKGIGQKHAIASGTGESAPLVPREEFPLPPSMILEKRLVRNFRNL